MPATVEMGRQRGRRAGPALQSLGSCGLGPVDRWALYIIQGIVRRGKEKTQPNLSHPSVLRLSYRASVALSSSCSKQPLYFLVAMPGPPHGQPSKSLSSKKPRNHGRSRSRVRSGNASRPGDKPSPNTPPQHQDDRQGVTGEALADTRMGAGQSSTLALALSQLHVSHHSTQPLWVPEGHTPRAHIGSWALGNVAEEPVDETHLTLSHYPPDDTGSRHKPSHPVPFELASDSTIVDYWSNAPIDTDAWHLIEPTQARVSPGRLDVEREISDMGATGSASPGWAQ